MRQSGLSLAVFALTLGVAAQAIAEGGVHNRYKWKDAQGNLHFDDALPNEALLLGYDVVNAQGIVVKHVNRAKTAEETKADEDAAAQQAAQKHVADEKAKNDQQILAAYPNEHELVSSQQAQLDMMDQNIHSTEVSLQSQEKSLTEILSHAADLDRNGKPVPATLQSQIESLRRNIEKQKAYIVAKQQEKIDTTKRFGDDLAHYRELQENAQTKH
ncbi:MAG: DUF4124 domain-containing protein [Rudaea sp.]|nr:DUF4124 domain-containing protein [Rudaea sp.]